MKYKSVITKHGSPSGRNAIYLDKIDYDYENQSVSFIGQFDAKMSKGYEGNSEWIDYKIIFKRVIHFIMTEIDHYEPEKLLEMRSSIEEDVDSGLITSLKENDHSKKVRSEHKHFIFSSYDDIFDIVATEIDVESADSDASR
jgi:hypothetical protein